MADEPVVTLNEAEKATETTEKTSNTEETEQLKSLLDGEAPEKTEEELPKSLLDGEGEDEGAPEAYEAFKLPEGVQEDAAVMTTFKHLAKEYDLPQEAAQKFVDLGAELLKRDTKDFTKKYVEQLKIWDAEIKEDPKYGGINFETTKERANRIVRKFGDEGLKQVLKEPIYGSNPALVRFLARIDEAISEDTTVTSKAIPAKSNMSIADIFYPTLRKNK